MSFWQKGGGKPWGLGGYLLRRLLLFLPMLLGVTLLSFALIQVAGSDVVLQQAEHSGIVLSPEALAARRAELGLDQPFWTQYFRWLRGFFTGDLGRSYVSGRDVAAALLSKLPATLLLAACSLLLTVAVSVPLGILAALFQNRPVDTLLRALSFVGNSMPNFFVALVLMYLLAICFPIFPVISTGLGLDSVALPALTLAVAMSSKYLRQVRTAVLEELGQDYVLGERARGIPFSATLWKSVLRTAGTTLLTLLSLSAGSLLGGTAIVESIFLWDGVGKLAVDAIQMRDYPMIQAYVVWMALIYGLVNLAADLLCRALDPRIRLEGGGV